MVTIQERAVQIQRARVEARPITRTEQKKLEVIQRQKRIPPPQVEIQKPSPEQERQRQEQERQRQEQEQLQKDWYGLRVMLSKGKPKSGYGAKALAMYTATRMETSHFLDALKKKGTITAQEEKILRKIHYDYRVSIGARTYIPGSVTRIGGRTIITSRFPVTSAVKPVFGPQLPREGDVGFIGPVRQAYVPPTPPPTTYFPSETKITREYIPELKIDVITQPTISREVVDVWESPRGEIPITETYFIDPTKRGEWEKRVATPKEEEYFKKQTSVLIASEIPAPSKVKVYATDITKDIQDITKTLNQQVKQITTEPTIGRLFKAIDYEPGKTDIGVTTEYLKQRGVPSVVAETGEVIAGAGLGILEDIYEKPLKQIALVAAGVVGGVVIRGGTAVITTTAGKLPGVASIITKGVQYGLTGAGLYLGGTYAVATAERVALAETPAEKGAIIGITAKDISLMGLGYAKGSKLYEQLAGKWATRGRVEIDIEKLVPKDVLSGKRSFPTAPKEKHLELFKRRKGGFHATSESFWKMEKQIIAQAGKSELPGLYVSPYISPHFARVSPGGQYKLFGLDILGKRPGVAFLEPKGFRLADIYKIPGKPSKPLGYEWVTPAKPGYIDIPRLKTEIEGLVRVGDKFIFKSGKQFVTIQGVKVPIDVFGYAGKPLPSVKVPPKISMKTLVKDILSGKEYDPSSYYLPGRKAIYTPSTFALSSILSNINKNTSSMLSKVNKSTSSIISKVSKTSSSVLKEQVKRRAVSEKSIMRSVNKSVSSALSYKIPGITDVPYSYVKERRRPLGVPPGVPPIPKLSKKALKKKLKKLLSPEYVYVPSFTARAVGMKAIEISERQAQKLIRKIMTGAEIRRPVRIKIRRRKKK